MTSEEIIKQMASLPTDARREIENLISRLAARYRAKEANPSTSLESEAFIGMWRDRDDMTDSTAWVRSVRHEHWTN